MYAFKILRAFFLIYSTTYYDLLQYMNLLSVNFNHAPDNQPKPTQQTLLNLLVQPIVSIKDHKTPHLSYSTSF